MVPYLICTHGYFNVLLGNLEVTYVENIIASQFQDVSSDIFQDSHNVKGHVIIYFITKNLLKVDTERRCTVTHAPLQFGQKQAGRQSDREA